MPSLVNFGVEEDMRPRSQMESSLYCPSRKRQRASASLLSEKRPRSIDFLPDECLFEILRRLPGGRERSLSACVSKRWLGLVSAIRPSEIPRHEKPLRKPLPDLNSVADADNDDDDDDDDDEDDDTDEDEEEEEENTGILTRSLEGKDVTDVRLVAMAVGTSGRGGLGKLSIRGSNTIRPVTDLGLSAIAHGCPALHALSLWNVPLVGDIGLAEIAASCPMLENLDLSCCPMITDKGLIAIAEKCPNLTSVSIDSCFGIANEALHAIGRLCPDLSSVTIKNCPLVTDNGIATLMCSASSTISLLRLEGLNITDLSLACIGHYGKEITDLFLTGLQNVAERGFWVMGNALGLRNLRSIIITACRGVTDVGLEAVAKGCPSLKQICLRKCSYVSDSGLKAFAEAAKTLESLKLEECYRVTLVGVLCALLTCNRTLKTLSLVKCFGVRDIGCFPHALPVCGSLRFLTISDCPGLTSVSLAAVGKIFPNLVQLDLSGLVGLTDAGLLPLVEGSNVGLVKVNLKGCANLTDAAVSTLVKVHGSTLRELNLDGCNKLTDKILLVVAECCGKLADLDMSEAAITDYGVAVLASARHLNFEILSLAGCSMVTDKIFPLLGNMGSSLVGLNLMNCNRISINGISALDEKLYWCDILS